MEGPGEDPASWWPFMWLEDLTMEASRQGRDETATRPQDWLISNPADVREVGSDFMNRVFENAEHRQMA